MAKAQWCFATLPLLHLLGIEQLRGRWAVPEGHLNMHWHLRFCEGTGQTGHLGLYFLAEIQVKLPFFTQVLFTSNVWSIHVYMWFPLVLMMFLLPVFYFLLSKFSRMTPGYPTAAFEKKRGTVRCGLKSAAVKT